MAFLSYWHIWESNPWQFWSHHPDLLSSGRQSLDPRDRPSWEGTSELGWRGEQIWSEELETTCSSRYQGRFYRACRYLGDRSWFWKVPLVGPLGTLLEGRVRNRKHHPHKGSRLGLQSWRRNVLGSSHLAQRRYQRLGLEQVFVFPIK